MSIGLVSRSDQISQQACQPVPGPRRKPAKPCAARPGGLATDARGRCAERRSVGCSPTGRRRSVGARHSAARRPRGGLLQRHKKRRTSLCAVPETGGPPRHFPPGV